MLYGYVLKIMNNYYNAIQQNAYFIYEILWSNSLFYINIYKYYISILILKIIYDQIFLFILYYIKCELCL